MHRTFDRTVTVELTTLVGRLPDTCKGRVKIVLCIFPSFNCYNHFMGVASARHRFIVNRNDLVEKLVQLREPCVLACYLASKICTF